ncbi:hypothetical protein BDQ17DRAFT_1427657 [Cyathus striatus]|nr:hypothetical protein BDQ17DRAFT_1427657 [Cyathus striatus]
MTLPSHIPPPSFSVSQSLSISSGRSPDSWYALYALSTRALTLSHTGYTNRDIPLPTTPTSNDHSLVPPLGHLEEPTRTCGYTYRDIPLPAARRPSLIPPLRHVDESSSSCGYTHRNISQPPLRPPMTLPSHHHLSAPPSRSPRPRLLLPHQAIPHLASHPPSQLPYVVD